MSELPTYEPDFEEYIRQGEPDKKAKAENWQVAIGLQQVDGLQVSDYLLETARRNIEGEISIDEVQRLIKAYYVSKELRTEDDENRAEADRVSTNINKILATRTLDFSVNGLISLHRRIFEGVFKHAGKVRDFDITKKEFVLRGNTVHYLNWEDLRRALEYDLEKEKQFSYAGLSQNEMIAHFTQFVSGLWQIHAFAEGNTRTTAVFTIQYLRSIGFDVDNEPFARNAWYFRNALVRANYRNIAQGIDYSPIYLERFFRNLLLGEQWELKSRYLVTNPPEGYTDQPRQDKEDVTQNVTQNVTQSITARQREILRLMQIDSSISAAKLAEQLGVTVRSIRRDIETLRAFYKINWIGSSKKGHWEIQN